MFCSCGPAFFYKFYNMCLCIIFGQGRFVEIYSFVECVICAGIVRYCLIVICIDSSIVFLFGE